MADAWFQFSEAQDVLHVHSLVQGCQHMALPALPYSG
eukprot:CAMPEP_0197664016 /NCGR_PEP_ID=MMETSP1338-20131121/58380_1 /TAXON_ID=43686 ORGANISM="Pelagodinium beii, Strain RCC1491" /NCGR_SAMPLE_ID=MMETSP1338 /ASSEMBLY_ACC=CAM_ASM_000754 /LENGTH=36 /DNA_ID= /DNA_START= /DNA_END= /DNA_ORIENTATION=